MISALNMAKEVKPQTIKYPAQVKRTQQKKRHDRD